jgi:hypothetical protein
MLTLLAAASATLPASGKDLELFMSIIISRPDGSSMNVQSP